MPLYDYECPVCKHFQSELRRIAERNLLLLCEKCSSVMKRVVSTPNIVTDTNFGYTGKYDSRLGGPKIEGRKDFWDRAKKKGLKEVDLRELRDRPQTMEKRLKKYLI